MTLRQRIFGWWLRYRLWRIWWRPWWRRGQFRNTPEENCRISGFHLTGGKPLTGPVDVYEDEFDQLKRGNSV